jgi:hypothetical protein
MDFAQVASHHFKANRVELALAAGIQPLANAASPFCAAVTLFCATAQQE